MLDSRKKNISAQFARRYNFEWLFNIRWFLLGHSKRVFQNWLSFFFWFEPDLHGRRRPSEFIRPCGQRMKIWALHGRNRTLDLVAGPVDGFFKMDCLLMDEFERRTLKIYYRWTEQNSLTDLWRPSSNSRIQPSRLSGPDGTSKNRTLFTVTKSFTEILLSLLNGT